APIGSTMMPSQRSSADTRRVGRSERRIGAITVGPVTTRIAPTSNDSCHGMPTTIPAAVINAQAMRTVTVHSRSTGWRRSFRSRERSDMLPSNRITPTAIVTPPNSTSRPNTSSGSTAWPRTNPTISSSRIDGNPNRQAIVWAVTASATTRAMYGAGSSVAITGTQCREPRRAGWRSPRRTLAVAPLRRARWAGSGWARRAFVVALAGRRRRHDVGREQCRERYADAGEDVEQEVVAGEDHGQGQQRGRHERGQPHADPGAPPGDDQPGHGRPSDVEARYRRVLVDERAALGQQSIALDGERVDVPVEEARRRR